MEKIVHTPGPWKVSLSVDGDFLGVYPATGKAEFPVAKMPEYVMADVSAANARLIAAAPDLLDVLERFSKFPFSHQGPAEGPMAVMLDQARAAIAKARG